MADNKSLGAAKNAKKDEFYTQLSDIEKEMRHYWQHFEGKTILCNCGDPFESNFFKYFVLNFNRLGLKKLITTSYTGSPIMGEQLLFGIDENGDMALSLDDDPAPKIEKKPYKAVITTVHDATGNDAVEMLDVAELFVAGENELTELEGNGDFRSHECIELLEEADIVITNPPFSLFREYMAQLMQYEKKFIIIGNKNALKYKEIFPLLKDNKIWIGYRNINADMWFIVPEGYSYEKEIDGQKVKHIMGCWYTNLDVKKRHEELILIQRYSPEKYPKYDNYDAIEVSKVADIPCDYAGVMGVPITFMDKYNPDQFEIIGRTGNIEWASSNECQFFTPPSEDKQREYKQQNKTWRVQNVYFVTDDGVAHTIYDRLFIRNKHPEQPKEV